MAPLDTVQLRIVHLFRAPLGGLFRHVCDLVAEQARMGHAVGIVCDSEPACTAAESRLAALSGCCALGIHRLPMGRRIAGRDLAAYRRIRALVTRLEPEVLHGHGAKGGAYARLMPRAHNRVALYTPHGGSLHLSWLKPADALYLGLERALRRRTDGLLFESGFGAAVYGHKLGRGANVRVVPNGLHAEDFAPVAATPVYDAVFVGELRKLKGVATLIGATAILAAERPFRIAIAGSGPDETKFRAQAADLGIADRVDFLGHQNARALFAKGRVVVVPSLAESLPYVVLEAIAARRPLVATRVGGIPEIFGPFARMLVPPENPHALASAIAGVLDRPIAARALAASLQERAREHFSSARMAHEITEFYMQLRRARSEVAARPAAIKVQETAAR
jgi:glycosyltransferase involved in cell wall biosynthesis